MEKFFVKFLDDGPEWYDEPFDSYNNAIKFATNSIYDKYEIWQITFGNTGKPKSERIYKV